MFNPSHCGNPGRDFSGINGVTILSHTASHYASSTDNPGANLDYVRGEHMKIIRWYVQQFAGLINKMKSTPELLDDGSMGNMLDNSIMIFLPNKSDSHLHSITTCQWPFLVKRMETLCLESTIILRDRNRPCFHQPMVELRTDEIFRICGWH